MTTGIFTILVHGVLMLTNRSQRFIFAMTGPSPTTMVNDSTLKVPDVNHTNRYLTVCKASLKLLITHKSWYLSVSLNLKPLIDIWWSLQNKKKIKIYIYKHIQEKIDTSFSSDFGMTWVTLSSNIISFGRYFSVYSAFHNFFMFMHEYEYFVECYTCTYNWLNN